MKKTIEKLLSKEEIRRMSKKDTIKTVSIDSNSTHIDSPDDVSEKESLLYRYGVFGKKVDKELSDKDSKKKIKSIDEDFIPEKKVEEDIIPELSARLDYNSIKDDLSRLASYEELSKQYKLTPEQNETVGEIYSRLKEAENEASNLGEDYQQMSEKVKEIADVSRRMMEEISGSYLKDISAYRHDP